MKLIVDAQLPKTLSDLLISLGHDSIHTLDLPKRNSTKDLEIIALSEVDDRIVISKDNDFLESFLLFNRPRKLILVKTGNIRNGELLKLFQNQIKVIEKHISENSLIEINKTEIVIHR